MTAPAPGPVPLEALLAHRDWVRALARSLVSDRDRADDVEQETWRMALERPPRHARSLRAWFGTVVRHAAAGAGRRDARRARLDAAAPPSRDALRPDDVVAEAELQTKLVREVLALEEPYRTTILRRFFHGEAPRDIAAREGVSVETVKTRLQRGVARLRVRMTDEIGEDRRAWALLLGGRPVAATAAGGAATKTALACAAAVVLAAVVGTRFAARDAALRADTSATASVARADDASRAPRRPRGGAGETKAAAAPVVPPKSLFLGNVEDEEGAPVAGAQVVVFASARDEFGEDVEVLDPGPSRGSAVAGADGAFEIAASGADEGVLVASAQGRAPAVADARRGLPVRLRLAAAQERETVVAAAEDRSPIAGARVVATGRFGRGFPAVAATTDAAGRARLVLGADAAVVVVAAGRATYRGPLSPTIWLARGVAVAGRVVDDAGAALAGAVVVAERGSHRLARRTDADGRFAFDGFSTPDHVALRASAPGRAPVAQPVAVGDESVRIVLSVWDAVRGVVLGADGAPAAGARVEAFALDERRPADKPAVAGADGRFEVRVPAGDDVLVRATTEERVRNAAYRLDVPALSGETTVSVAERRAAREVVLRLAPAVVSYARIVAVDPDGVRQRVGGLHASWKRSEAHDEGDGLRLAFELSGGTRVEGLLATRAPDDLRRPEVVAALTTSATADAPATTVVVPRAPLLRVRALDPDGVAFPVGHAPIVLLWELRGDAPACLGSCMGVDEPRWRLDPTKRYAVEARAGGFGSGRREFDATDADGGAVEVRLGPAARLRGRLVAADGRPAGNATVTIEGGSDTAFTDAQGAFDLKFPAGEAAMCVIWGGAATMLAPGRFSAAPGATVETGDVRLPPLVEAKGRVVDADGLPAGGADVWFAGADVKFAFHVATDAAGVFSLKLPAGARGLAVATKLGHGAAWGALDAQSATPVEIALARGGRARVVLRGDPARVRSVNTVGVRAADGAVLWWPPRRRIETRRVDEAVWVLDDLPPGKLVVFADAHPRRFEAEIEVVLGETAVTTLE